MNPGGAIHGRMPWRREAALAAWLLGLSASALTAQGARTAVVPDSAEVGDVVTVAIRLVLPPGQRAIWPDTLSLPEESDVENAARVRERVDTLDDGRLQVTALYAVTPWRTGEQPLGEARFQVIGGAETPETRTAELPTLRVVSVLPADTAGIEPRPAKGVIGRSWSWWPIILTALAVLLLAALLGWWIRRRRQRRPEPALAPAPTARERALAALDAARSDGLLERGEVKAFYIRVAVAVRHFLAAMEPAWGEELTTTELMARIRAMADPEEARGLEGILRAADQVKFARRRPEPATAHQEWAEARAWVVAFRREPEPVREEAAA